MFCTILRNQFVTIYRWLQISYRAKHPTKVHVWAGISWRGRTGICIFEGIMNAELYVKILISALLPFLRDVYPDGHKFMQGNDPKHTSNYAKRFYDTQHVNWMKTPPESPNLNPIKNLWHEMKEFLRREVKPKTKEKLINAILGNCVDNNCTLNSPRHADCCNVF